MIDLPTLPLAGCDPPAGSSRGAPGGGRAREGGDQDGPGVQSGAGLGRRRRGFTIAEVMVAATVMALAITTSITTMQSAFLALDSARSMTFASQIMQSEIEKIRLRNWQGIVDLGTGTASLVIPSVFTNYAAIGSRFTLTREIAVISADLRQITLRISWRGYDGRRQTRFYTTFYGRNGLYDYLSR